MIWSWVSKCEFILYKLLLKILPSAENICFDTCQQKCCNCIVCICTSNIIKDGFQIVSSELYNTKYILSVLFSTIHCCCVDITALWITGFLIYYNQQICFSECGIHWRENLLPSMTSTCNNAKPAQQQTNKQKWITILTKKYFEMQMVACYWQYSNEYSE